MIRKKTKNSWQILRRIIKQFKEKLTFIDNNENNHIFLTQKK